MALWVAIIFFSLINPSPSLISWFPSLTLQKKKKKRGVFNEEGRREETEEGQGSVELVGEDWGLFNI